MAYRNGTYVAFHAQGTNIPIDTDMKYYNLLKAWTAKTDDDFSMINSHDKTAAVRDSSLKETLEKRLKERLRNSKHLLLIIGKTTKYDTDWVPFEIEYAVDECDLPIIAVYPDFEYIQNVNSHSEEWPKALKDRIEKNSVRVIHIPFKKEPIKDAISQFNHNNKPTTAVSYYSKEAYKTFGINIP